MVDAELAKELKIYAVTRGTTMKQIIEDQIRKVLDDQQK